MTKLSLPALALALCLAAPAAAFEHEVVIAHPEGPIAADYAGSVKVETRQLGTAAAPGRQSTLRCQWSASLDLERTAKVGETLQTRRAMRADDVVSGATPGWCRNSAKVIDQLVAAQRDRFHAAMLALVEQDRNALLAEASRSPAGRES